MATQPQGVSETQHFGWSFVHALVADYKQLMATTTELTKKVESLEKEVKHLKEGHNKMSERMSLVKAETREGFQTLKDDIRAFSEYKIRRYGLQRGHLI